jgi:hypothetical protein
MASHAAALRALELQGRHLGMWKDRPAGTGEVSIADAIRQRVAGKAVQGTVRGCVSGQCQRCTNR